MSWPLSQDYNEAIQSPTRNFADPDLRGGEVMVNPLGLPLPCSGNFADVYQVRAPDGLRWAVKCFTREVAGLHKRYDAISNHLRQAKLPFTVDFSYIEEGIRVRGRWYPVLKMQWVEGLTLNQFVGRYADKPAYLEALLQIWVRMSKYLRAAEVGHCDLQHGNVMLVPGAGANSLALKLVDYDGMWVPALAGTRSGEVGHPSYQHPQRLRDQNYDIDVDRFPLLLIATGLRAITVKGRELWDKHDNGDNILFRQTDLQAPTKSHLFLDLIKSGDPLTAALADHVLKALRGGVAAAPLLEEVIPEAPAPPTVRAARPSAAVSESRGGAAVAVATPTVTARARPVVRRPVRKASGVRTAAWIAVAAVLLVALGAGWVVYHATQNGHDGKPTQPQLAQHRPDDDDPEAGVRHAQTRPVPTEPIKEERPTEKIHDPPVRGTNPEKPKATAKPIEPDKPKETAKPKDTGKPMDTARPKEPVKPKRRPPITDLKEELKTSLGMVLVGIHEGGFLMGSPPEELGRKDEEGPQQRVRITRPFYMGKYPVTKGEFEFFVKLTNYKTDAEQRGDKETWREPGFDQTADNPVVCVSWNDAKHFCEWLSKEEEKSGLTYHLPTEAQWEYACRARTQTAYFFGNDAALLKEYAWFRANSDKRTHTVGGTRRNPWRLEDVCGNVAQWCLDGLRPYTKDDISDPEGPEAADSKRVLRGGHWDSLPPDCRSAARMQLDPKQSTNTSGFRVVCEP
jgi:formylglycine-generating enzyme required for sulfatase activity